MSEEKDLEKEKDLANELNDVSIGSMPIRKDLDLEPMADDDPRKLKLGWVVRVIAPGEDMGDPPGDHQGTEYSDPYIGEKQGVPLRFDAISRRQGYTSIPVLPFLTGKPWNNLAINWMKALRTSDIRVTTGFVTLDTCPWRVTVLIDENKIIKSITQEVDVGLIGVHHGAHLNAVTKDPDFIWDNTSMSVNFNMNGVKKETLDTDG